ncbi:Os01g0385600 [Oryza sativa Japonica Group]|uniref:Os01g0385600 protein n=1 Tax=Oryza sativa subsp. japonica TaxID=39947 RepID=Q0JML4_ORYSJ|nr:Os01g0385600 [Oryza sativa Japonica Group]|eukprot:NP_001043100.2 Os01g0385600 [Oryza sativa Japonica Group]
MAGSSAYRPPTDAKTDVQIDLEQWGLESRPLGGLVDFIKNTTDPMHHVTEGCQLQPINVENGNNGNSTRTEKRLGWSTEEDLRLVSAWLNNSNDPIESNFKKNDKYWADVAAAYNSTTPSSRFRQVKQVKDRFSKIKKKVGNFCCSWKEANSLYASGECNVDLMAKAQKIYENDFKDGPFLLTQCWNELKTQPKCHAYLDQLDKLTRTIRL